MPESLGTVHQGGRRPLVHYGRHGVPHIGGRGGGSRGVWGTRLVLVCEVGSRVGTGTSGTSGTDYRH